MVINVLQSFVQSENYNRIVIFTDKNLLRLYPDFFDFIDESKRLFIELPVGESTKSLSVYNNVCEKLLTEKIDRKSLVVNWGGGSVSDFGGFVAATFKRGLPMVNVPTTLLAMIDAAYGGKNGLDFNSVKNVIGTFHQPLKVFSDTFFLKTLPESELLNGLGEMLKYALLEKNRFWQELITLEKIDCQLFKQNWITYCADLKNSIVAQDPYDESERHVLNLGHTTGHSLEMALGLSHGFAVAVGCLLESVIACQRALITPLQFSETESFVRRFFPIPSIEETQIERLVSLCMNDKKINGENIRCILPLANGRAKEFEISVSELSGAFRYLVNR